MRQRGIPLHNPKRQRGIALLTIRTGDLRPGHDAVSDDAVDSLIEDSAEESLADASGYERSVGFQTDASGYKCEAITDKPPVTYDIC